MGYPTGQVVSAPLTNGSSAARFGTHIDFLGTGGYRAVATLAERDAIPTKPALEYDGLGSGQRRHLMLVAVQETLTLYLLYIPAFATLASDADRLAALGSNSHWVTFQSYLSAQPGQVLTADQFAAIQAANAPSAQNPYATLADVHAATSGATIDETNLVHKTGDETLAGVKTLTDELRVSVAGDGAYKVLGTLFAPDLHQSNNALLAFGLAGGNQNATEWRFYYDGNGSGANRCDFGFSGVVSPAFSYLPNGRVGFGTTAPSQKVTVVEGSSEVRLGSGCQALTPTISVINNAGGRAAALLAGTQGSGFYFDKAGPFTISATDHYAFTDNQVGCRPAVDAITVTGGGQVGVGVSSPGELLEVGGNVKAQKVILSQEVVINNQTGQERGLIINQSSDDPASAAITLQKDRAGANAQPGDLIGFFHQRAFLNGQYTSDRALLGGYVTPNNGIGYAFITGKFDGNYTPALRVDENGNVAIGDYKSLIPYQLQSTSEKLEVNGNVKAQRFIGDGSQLTGLSSNDANAVHLSGDQSISGTKTFNGQLRVNYTPNQDALYFKGGPGGRGSTAGIAFDATGVYFGNNVSARYSFTDDGAYGAHHVWETKFSPTVSLNTTEKMRLTTEGNLGIGLPYPSEKLEVNGNARAIDFYAGGQLLVIADGSYRQRGIGINQTTDDDLTACLTLQKVRSFDDAREGDVIGTIHQQVQLNGGLTNDRALLMGYLAADGGIGHAFTTGKADNNYRPALRVDENGNVAIGDYGTLIPYALGATSEKLEVNGNVKAQKFIGDGSQLTGLPTGGGPTQANAPVFTASADGPQTLTLPSAPSALVSVTLLEVGSTILTRLIWEDYCSISGANLTITADAQVRSGDKILVKYLT